MKIQYLLYILPAVFWAQSTEVFNYKYTFLFDTISNERKTEKYHLLKKQKDVYFVGDYYLYLDSLRGNDRQTSLPNRGIITSNPKIKRNTLKGVKYDLSNTYVFFKNYFDKVKISYPDSINIKWEIAKDIINYNRFLCRKAYTTYKGRNYVAYFTEEIPYPYGPYLFKGLPGLIVKLFDTEEQHVFELLSITKEDIDYSLAKYKKLSENEFNAFEGKFEKDPLKVLLPERQFPEHLKAMYRQKLKSKKERDNNPIERAAE